MKKRIKMIDVARQAQVSQTTVSLVLNNIPGVRIAEETRQRVIDTARAIGYSPGPSLSELQSTAQPIVGVLINEISAAYPIDLIDGLHVAARTQGVQLAIFITDGVVERETQALHTLAGMGAEKIVYANTFTAGVHPSEELQKFRHVYLNCFRNDRGGVAVIPGERAAGFVAAQHLIEIGCTRIATITGDAWHSSAQRRLSGFKRGLTRGGLHLDPDLVRHGSWSHKSGRQAMQDLLAHPVPPDAVFCHNDMMARGAMAAIAEAGLTVPGDIAILGFDDREFAGDIGLSTLFLPHAQMAERAMALLGRSDMTGQGATLPLRCPLIVRESTRRIDAAAVGRSGQT